MENPAHWTPATKCIFNALREHEKHVRAGFIGGSDALYVYQALLKAGFLVEPKPTEVPLSRPVD